MKAPRFSLCAAALAAALLAACSSGSPRPEPAKLQAIDPVIDVSQAWAAKLGSTVNFPLQPQVLGNRVVLAADDGTVAGFDAANGQRLWSANAGDALTAGVGSDGHTSAVVTRSNQVVALAEGRVLWKHKLGTQSYTAPLVAGGRVFVLGADRSLTALDGRTGARLWHADRQAEPLVLRQSGVLLAVGNTLVAGLSGRLAGVDPDTGASRWEVPLAAARGVNDVEKLVDLVGPVSRQGSVICARAFQAAVGCVDAAVEQARQGRCGRARQRAKPVRRGVRRPAGGLEGRHWRAHLEHQRAALAAPDRAAGAGPLGHRGRRRRLAAHALARRRQPRQPAENRRLAHCRRARGGRRRAGGRHPLRRRVRLPPRLMD